MVELQWSKTSKRKMNWNDAVEYAKQLQEGGFDWRLPTIKELFSIIDYDRIGSVCTLPECRSYDYWTGSTCADNPDYAWYVNFYFGYVYANDKYDTLYVRCVRLEQ